MTESFLAFITAATSSCGLPNRPTAIIVSSDLASAVCSARISEGGLVWDGHFGRDPFDDALYYLRNGGETCLIYATGLRCASGRGCDAQKAYSERRKGPRKWLATELLEAEANIGTIHRVARQLLL